MKLYARCEACHEHRHQHDLRILQEAGVITKRIQGAKGYMSLRKADLDRRFPGLIDSVLSADAEPVA